MFILWGSYAAQEAGADRRRSPHDHRVAAPVAAVGAQRILRQPTVQPRQRGARRPRSATDRLGALMSWTERIAALRPIRRRSRIADFVLDVLDAYGRHRTGRNASLLAYMGLLTVFPLLLVATTILGLVLESNQDLQDAILDSFLSKIPVVGATILKNQGRPHRQLGGAGRRSGRRHLGLVARLRRAADRARRHLGGRARPPQLLRATAQQPDLPRSRSAPPRPDRSRSPSPSATPACRGRASSC